MIKTVTEHDINLNKEEYERLCDVFKVAGKIRAAYLEKLLKNEVHA